MGKKRKMRAYPQKYGRKYANHPYQLALNKLKGVVEKAEADGVVTPEEEIKIEEAAAVVEKVAKESDIVNEMVEPKPELDPDPIPVPEPEPEPLPELEPAKKVVKKVVKKTSRKKTLKSKKDS